MHESTWADVRTFAENANMKHGLMIDNDDKKAILESRLERQFYENENGYLASDQVIAESLKVSRPTITAWIEEITTGKNLPVNLSIRAEKDGIERDSQQYLRSTANALPKPPNAVSPSANVICCRGEAVHHITQHLVAKYRDAYANGAIRYG